MKFKILTYGCKVNSYESSSLFRLLSEAGHKEAKRGETADLVILNSCAVTEEGAKKSRHGFSRLRRENPDAVAVAMGCASEEDKAAFLSRGADIIMGTAGKTALPQLLSDYDPAKGPICYFPEKESFEEPGTTSYGDRARAYLKIQDGCSSYCAYCLVPYLRGKTRSRDPRKVIEEAMALADLGYHEIVLTGIHVGMYGRDLGGISLSSLLQTLFEKLPSDCRIRLGSVEESEIDWPLLWLLRHEPRLCGHFHMPLQSGSASVLKRMGRPYTPEQYLRKCRLLRGARPDIALAADVIVGFPGETEEEFRETYDFIKEAGLSFLHVFPYSLRKGTRAASLPGQIAPEEKKKRVKILLGLADELGYLYKSSMEGKKVEALLEESDGNGGFIGHTGEYLKVRCPASTGERGSLVSLIYGPECRVD